LLQQLDCHNFAVPAVLKAWVDHVVRAGKTFGYAAGTPEGLLAGKNKKVLAIASGGNYIERFRIDRSRS
jgi:FMN-dependent NADH-azoreductase